MTESGVVVAENARTVLERCADAARRSGREPNDVTIVAVSKTHPMAAIREALGVGLRDFGENRVQEAAEKWSGERAAGLRLHMVGRLQRNKARPALELFDLIHSCDSVELAERLSRLAGEVRGGCAEVLLEVNVSGEASKAGFAPRDVAESLDRLLALPDLRVRGLMIIAPAAESPEAARPYFVALRALSDRLRAKRTEMGGELSMGMTDDYEVAIEEGATMVRIGRAIFGVRRPG